MNEIYKNAEQESETKYRFKWNLRLNKYKYD